MARRATATPKRSASRSRPARARTPVAVIVPARLASSRFPEKVLADRTGRPLVQHVADQAAAARRPSLVAVACDHPKIRDALSPFGTRVLMTRADHPNGTSRLAEAAAILRLPARGIVVNAQGDEPEMSGRVIDAVVDALIASPKAQVATACAPFTAGEDPANPNIVKVVRSRTGSALYFSRASIPFDRDGRRLPDAEPMRHVGIYAYRVSFLRRYVSLAPTPLEQAEQLEQLRVLEHGFAIAVTMVDPAWLGGGGIDTPEQYEAFVRRWTARSGSSSTA